MDTAKLVGTSLVGQSYAKSLLLTWNQRNNFPHFLLIAGYEGSGRKSLAYLVAEYLDAQLVVITDLAVNNVRATIEAAYNIDAKVVYLFANADNMSAAAKNSMLKFTEEPPENAYIIMTLKSIQNTLFTLQSRSQHIVTAPYTYDELRQLCEEDRLCRIATTPGMLVKLMSMTAEEVDNLIETSSKLVNFIDKVSLANALKSASFVKFKESDKGVELDMLVAAVRYVLECMLSDIMNNSDSHDILRVACWLRALSNWEIKFSYSSVNKKALYDQFIMEVRNRIGGASRNAIS